MARLLRCPRAPYIKIVRPSITTSSRPSRSAAAPGRSCCRRAPRPASAFMKSLLEALATISKVPEKNPGKWLSSAQDSIEFLKESIPFERTLLFVSMPAVLIHAVLAPLDSLDPPDQADLSNDFVMPDDKWAIEHVS